MDLRYHVGGNSYDQYGAYKIRIFKWLFGKYLPALTFLIPKINIS